MYSIFLKKHICRDITYERSFHQCSENTKKTVLHSIEQTKKILACRLAMKKVKRWAAKSRQQTPKFKQSQSFHSTEQTCLRTLTHCVFNVLEETKKPKFERNFHLKNFFPVVFDPSWVACPRASLEIGGFVCSKMKLKTGMKTQRCRYTREEPVVQVSITRSSLNILLRSRWTKVKYLPDKFWFLAVNGFRSSYFILNFNNFHFSPFSLMPIIFQPFCALVQYKLNFKWFWTTGQVE